MKVRIHTTFRTALFAIVAWTPFAAVPAVAAADYEVGGNDLLVSFMGSTGETYADDGIFAADSAAAYDAANHTVLVVWSGVDSVGDGEEIWGQLIDVESGVPIGGDFPISDSGFGRTAQDPAVTWDSLRQRFFVVWSSDASAFGEFEIYGQVLDASGGEVGLDDFRISSMGLFGSPDYDAQFPDVVYNPTHDTYLVIWSGDDLTDGEEEIWAQPVSAANPQVSLFVPWQVSDYAAPGDTNYDVRKPDLIYQADDDEYAAVFQIHVAGQPNAMEPQIWGRTLRGSDAEPQGSLRQISNNSLTSPGGERLGHGRDASIAYNSAHGEYFVVWQGAGWSNEPYEVEIWGRRMDAPGLDPLPFHAGRQLTDAAPAGDKDYVSRHPSVVYHPGHDKYFVVFDANHIISSEFEIRVLPVYWKGRVAPGVPVAGYQLSDMGGWTPAAANPDYDAWDAAAILAGDRLFASWTGDDDTTGLGNDDLEIFGQFFTHPGAQLHQDDFELGVLCFWSKVVPASTEVCY